MDIDKNRFVIVLNRAIEFAKAHETAARFESKEV